MKLLLWSFLVQGRISLVHDTFSSMCIFGFCGKTSLLSTSAQYAMYGIHSLLGKYHRMSLLSVYHDLASCVLTACLLRGDFPWMLYAWCSLCRCSRWFGTTCCIEIVSLGCLCSLGYGIPKGLLTKELTIEQNHLKVFDWQITSLLVWGPKGSLYLQPSHKGICSSTSPHQQLVVSPSGK